jgi:hypothetical protein
MLHDRLLNETKTLTGKRGGAYDTEKDFYFRRNYHDKKNTSAHNDGWYSSSGFRIRQHPSSERRECNIQSWIYRVPNERAKPDHILVRN